MSIGLMPAYSRPSGFVTGNMTVATGKYGMVVARDTGTTNHEDVLITTAAGQKPLGVIQSRGDENNSGLFAVDDKASIAKEGFVEVLFAAGEVIVKDDIIIASGTAGHAKVLAAEVAPYWILGRAAQTITIGAAAGLASVDLGIQLYDT